MRSALVGTTLAVESRSGLCSGPPPQLPAADARAEPRAALGFGTRRLATATRAGIQADIYCSWSATGDIHDDSEMNEHTDDDGAALAVADAHGRTQA